MTKARKTGSHDP